MPPILRAHPHPVALAASESLRACFGIGCAHHHRCARYEAVVDSEASGETFGTCLSAGRYPLFIDVVAAD
jgi:hypothetical protein